MSGVALREATCVAQEPTYPDAILARHRLREIAVTDRVTKMITSLEKQLQIINTESLFYSHPNISTL